ncbi:hypothetical protein [Pseudoalteromonas peptidolytica]|uniref:Uncharacterized protein n=1 Tax=Pseudoalteromonas peptidolytica F12-50-A1 TaxID=1315280 RepID=A0A8I0MY91_9GAMM|nr:hypothetical protein [Pseudoalteromonas peptidolytica]MBE0348262.1 hypothetical protein [Pseudoalteromonas peptidolytica F12-50-A1]NLR16549.1 hypothetical protein [Pseudoalteromonas peptidolytica]GEK08917.1 hypothetical protein PPE03_11660 [Pseudoalteromonas peptidolytica]
MRDLSLKILSAENGFILAPFGVSIDEGPHLVPMRVFNNPKELAEFIENWGDKVVAHRSRED